MNNLPSLALSLAAALSLVAPVAAQFPGDSFFRTPSKTAEQGGLVEMDVEFFGGSAPLGAAHYEVTFDPNQLSIEEIRSGDSIELLGTAAFRKRQDRVVAVHWNSKSASRPIGTAHLVRIVFRVIAPEGNVAQLQVVPRDFVRATGVRYPTIRGATGTITVTGPGSQPGTQPGPEAATAGAAVEPAILELVGTMRRSGSVVRFWMPFWDGNGFSAVPLEVLLPPLPGTPKDEVEQVIAPQQGR